MRALNLRSLLACLAVSLLPPISAAETVRVAMAANFSTAMQALAADFQRRSNHTVVTSLGSTGQLYAQITEGAPFDVFLAADDNRPQRLEAAGLAVPGSRFTYALGQISLWSADPHLISDDGRIFLERHAFRRLAIANPKLAPYGVAAVQALIALGVYDDLQDRLVFGQNIGQTHALVATGNAEVGVVARSYLVRPHDPLVGSRWDIPAHLHQPIRQDAVLLLRAQDRAAARQFLDYLKSGCGRRIIEQSGYAVSPRA